MSLKIEPEYFKKHMRFLTVFGIDVKPVENVWYDKIYRVYSVFILGYIYIYGLMEVIDVFKSPDFNSMTFGLSYSVTHILGLAKISIFIAKKRTFRRMLVKLESGYFLPNAERGGEKEFGFVKAAVRRINIHVDFFNTFVNLIVGIRCLYALLDKGIYVKYTNDVNATMYMNEDINSTMYMDEAINTTMYTSEDINSTMYRHIRILPYKAWFPMDLSDSPGFEIMFLVQFTCLLLFGYYIGFLDSVVYGMMIHMTMQYKILDHLLSRYVAEAKSIVLQRNPNAEIEDKASEAIRLPGGIERPTVLTMQVQKVIQGLVHYCAKYHLEIIDYCDEIENEFSYLMLLQFLSSLYILCFQLFQLSLVSNYFSFDSISMCLYLILMMYQLFCYCWYGNEVMLESNKISGHIYNTDWLLANETTKKSLLLMMMRAQRPTTLTAGKFALLSLETYVTIVRGSASYFMVLNQMQ